MEVHNKNIYLTVGVSKKVPDLAVSLSFNFQGAACCCFNKLKGNCNSSHSLMKGSHESALAYAMFEAARDKLVSSPLEVFKSRVSGVRCVIIDNNMTINWNCQGTGSSLRKTCGLVLSSLAPHKLFSKYSENIRFLSGKGGNKEHFNFVAKKAIEGLKKLITIAAVGKINTDDKKLKDIMDVVVKKMPDLSFSEKGESPVIDDSKDEAIEFPFIKCSGIAAVALADYIRSNSGGMGVDVCNSGITIFNNLWESKRKQLKESRRIKDYVEKKYSRLGAEFSGLFAYFAISQNYAHAGTVAKIIKSKPDLTKIVNDIKDLL